MNRLLRGGAILAVAAVVIGLSKQAGHALVVAAELPAPDAIVSLASHEWERLPATARLARAMPAALVLLTEPVKLNDYNCSDCANRVQTLVNAGIDQSRIVVLGQKVTRTYDEAVAVREWTTTTGARSIVVVTSPYHTRRSLATFRHVFEATGVAVGIRPASETSPADPARWWSHQYDRKYVIYESSASVFYLIRFGILPI